MPFDSQKKFHMNTQRAMAADKMPKKPPMPPKAPNVHSQSGSGEGGVKDAMPDEDMGDSTRTMISHNGDGTHSVQHDDGEETGPHETIEDALAAVMAKKGGGGMQHEGGMPKHGMPMHEHAMMSGM